MMNHLLPADAPWNWFALEVVLKGTLLLFLASGIVLLLGRSSAAVRHCVWSLLFVGLLLLPLVQLAVPGLSWQIVPHHWEPEGSQLAMAAADGDFPRSRPNLLSATEYTARASVAATEDADSPPALHHAELIASDHQTAIDEAAGTALATVEQTPDESSVGSSTTWLALLWLFGTGVALVPLVVGIFGNLRLRRSSRPCADGEWLRMAAALSHHLGLRRNVTLLFSGSQQMPITFGLLRPCVVLPSSADNWSIQRRRIVLLHELAHIKRCDVPLQLLARLATAIYWFHPLVWWALRQMRYEREQACDDCVLEAGQQAPDYASELLEIARAHRRSSPLLSAALSMARPSQLEGRLLAVLDMHRPRGQVSRAAAIRLIMLMLSLVTCIGLVRPTLQAEATASTNHDDASAATEDPSKPATKLVVTGTVLSSQGKPVPAATVEVIAYHRSTWRRGVGEDKVDHYQARADADGRFRLVLPRDISRPSEFTQLLASAEGYALNDQWIESTLTRKHVEIRLHKPRQVRLQLIDTAGNPLANIQPQIKGAYWKDDDVRVGVGIAHRNAHLGVSGWPQCSRSDEEGYVSVTVPAPTESLLLLIDNERLGGHWLGVKVDDKPTTVALPPARFVNGAVTAGDTGKPVAGAEVVLMEEPFRRVRTGADGTFRLASSAKNDSAYPGGLRVVHVYPPPESPYLFGAVECKFPNDGIGDAELAVDLKRGIVVDGQVIEKGSSRPVKGAMVYFDPQEENNPYFREDGVSRFSGSNMKYLTDEDGRFRMPVLPGPGYLLVRGPTLDFVPVQLTLGDRQYGKPGLRREYYHGALRINLEPDKSLAPLKIELERGVTLRRRVLRPDGQPAAGKAYSHVYPDNENIDRLLHVPVENGLLEIPGFGPGRSKPILIMDLDKNCAATVSPTASEVTLDSPPIQLKPCGAAKFRFVTNKGTVLADYEPMLRLIVTPGAPDTGFIQPDQPLWADSIFWPAIVQPGTNPKTGSDGRVTIDNLIPGASYRVSFGGTDGLWTDGHEFTVRSGETVDVGEVVIPERD